MHRLLALARHGRRVPPLNPPPGFTTRVAARAVHAHTEDGLLLWENLARWGLAAALVLCLLTAVFQQRVPEQSFLADFAGLNDSVEELW